MNRSPMTGLKVSASPCAGLSSCQEDIISAFIRPIKGSPRISRDFAGHLRGKSVNPGVDYAVGTGTPIYAPAAGVIQVDDDHAGGAAGISVVIYHTNGHSSDLLHLSRNTVHRGQRVAQGDLVGYSGNTGASTGPHLHWTLRTRQVAWYGNAGNVDGETKIGPAPLPAPTPAVKWDQERLNVWRAHWGLPPIQVDGVRGPQTIEATKDAQRRFGITDDGVAGPVTDGYLGKNPPSPEPTPEPEPRPEEPLEPEPMPEPVEPAEPEPTPEPVEPEPAPEPELPEFPEPTPVEPGEPEPPLQHAKPVDRRAGLAVLIGSAIALVLGFLSTLFTN